jgi:amphi-Trp domain-containing protein
MGRETVLFRSEERKDLQEVSSFLRQLADKLDQNRVILRRGAEEVTLEVPHVVVLELKVEEETKKGRPKRTLEIEIEWVEGEDQNGSVVLG